MAHSAHPRMDTALLVTVLSISSLTMIWLFWHHPVKTAIATIGLLCAFALAARLARWIETDSKPEIGDREHSPS